jgi:hypothetical protein
MKKSVLLVVYLVMTILPNVPVSAGPVSLSVGGRTETNIVYVSQKEAFKYKYKYDNEVVTKGKKNNYGIANETKLEFKANGKSDLGFSYGGKIRMNADTSIDTQKDDVIADNTMIFIENSYGRLEGGAYDSASSQMKVSGASVAFATGGIDGRFPKWFGKGPHVNSKFEDNGKFSQRYIVYPELPIDCDCIPYANKISYFTPIVNGFQAGISYSPDVAIHGTVYKFHNISRKSGKDFKDLFDYGFTYNGKFKDLAYTIGLTGEIGKAKKSNVTALNRTDLNAWELGAKATYKEFSVAGSYSDWGSSMTPKNKILGKKYGSKYWTAGVAYEKGNFGTSLTYFKSHRASTYTATIPTLTSDHDSAHNKLEYYVLSTQYLLAKGFLPYIELARFKAKDSYISGNKGYVALTGIKLAF